MSIKVQVDQGDLNRILRKCEPDILHKPLKDFFEGAAIEVQKEARVRASVDTGHLRNAIMYEIDGGTPSLWAKTGLLKAADGSPLWFKARAMEYGTGRQGDPAVSHKGKHWPPGGALARWGQLHGGASGWAIAAAIGRAGGLRPRPYLRPGLQAAIPRIKTLLGKLGRDIGRGWD